MSFIGLILILVIIGVCLYLINNYVPMAPPIKTLINVLVVLFAVIWLLSATGLIGTTLIGPMHVPMRFHT